jgi:hypothetical protein
MPKNTDFTKRIIPLFVIVMIGFSLSACFGITCHELRAIAQFVGTATLGLALANLEVVSSRTRDGASLRKRKHNGSAT